jgi:phosphoglycolate phosphatase
MAQLPKPRAVIFDWDNTLVDTWPIIHEALAATFAEMQVPLWTLAQTQARVRKSMRDSFPEIFGEDWQKAGEIYQRHYRANHLKKLTALPLAAEVLEAVHKRGIYNVIVSNKKGPGLRLEVDHMGWRPLLNKIVSADDAARDKPHPDPVHLVFEESGIVPAADVWFIGDSEIDLECAKNTGCTAILYGTLAKNHPDYTASHYQGFPYHAHVHGHDETLKLLARY